MKLVLWGVFALIAVLWTGSAALFAQLAQWSADGLASGGGASAGAVAAMAMPAWLAPWIDAATWAAAQQSLGAVLTSFSAILPSLGGIVGWIGPVIWAIWGMGLLALLALTLAGTWAIHRLRSPHSRRAQAL